MLILPLAILMLRQDGWRPRPSLAWLLLAAACGRLASSRTSAALTGSPTAFLDAQQAWGRNGFGGAGTGETIAAMFSPYQAGAARDPACARSSCWCSSAWTGCARSTGWCPVLFIAAELSSGSLEAVGRITMAAFPYVWILAKRRSIAGATRVAGRLDWPVHRDRDPVVRRVLGTLSREPAEPVCARRPT